MMSDYTDYELELREKIETLQDEVEKLKKSAKQWCDKAFEKHDDYKKLKQENTDLKNRLNKALDEALEWEQKYYNKL